MKVGDIVEVFDGSWSMSLIKGEMQHVSGTGLAHRKFRVLATGGNYPGDYQTCIPDEPNDTLLVDVKDPDFVLFIQEASCRVLKSRESDVVEITVPSGTDKIVLHLPAV